MASPRGYRSFSEFEREEIRSHIKLGWSLDDFYAEARPLDPRAGARDPEPTPLDFDE